MRASVLVLTLAVACAGCASSGVIRGTLSARTPAPGSGGPPPEADSARVSVDRSVLDAVVYVERLHGREPVGPTARTLSRVELKDQGFRPRILAIPAGSSVEFANHDTLFHSVFSVSPARKFDLGRCGRGKTRRVTFERPGLVKVYCTIHPNMAAYILVVPSEVFARPDSLGRFALPRLPRGTYVVNVWHPDFPVVRRNVKVSGREDSEIVVTLGS